LPLQNKKIKTSGIEFTGFCRKIRVVFYRFCQSRENGSKLLLKEGDAIIEVVDKWHYGKNEGSVPAIIVIFYAGYEGEPITIYKK